MRKILIVCIIILVLLGLAAVYIFIPSTLIVSNVVYCKATFPGTNRMLQSTQKWKQWWINKSTINKNGFFYNSDEYAINNLYNDGIDVTIHHNNDTIKSELRVIELEYDSVAIQWKLLIQTGLNPSEKISNYKKAVALKNNAKDILECLKNFIEQDNNVYSIPIKLSSIEHVQMITTKKMYQHNPSTVEVYNNINFLKRFAVIHNLKQDYYPMMNVIKNNDTSYRLMVALPVDKKTDFTGYVHSVQMVKGNFMVTEVRGGYGTIDNALNEMQLYFDDYQKITMAIPFQYIMTDRLNEPDTTKWITSIYAPVQ